jgi:hypothetical protein
VLTTKDKAELIGPEPAAFCAVTVQLYRLSGKTVEGVIIQVPIPESQPVCAGVNVWFTINPALPLICSI